jgi:hypothetical protein
MVQVSNTNKNTHPYKPYSCLIPADIYRKVTILWYKYLTLKRTRILSNPRKWSQEAHFEHFGALGTEVARSGLRKPILSILGPWPQKSPEVVSGSSF